MTLGIGEKIKNLRQQKGITQEQLANYLGISYQSVSKWENQTTTPDISLLPDISAFFGVSIDSLFEISKEKRLERLMNLTEEVEITPDIFEREEAFLLEIIAEKTRESKLRNSREEELDQEKAKPYGVLGDLYLNQANRLQRMAEECAKRALELDPLGKEYHLTLIKACQGAAADVYTTQHSELIRYYQNFVETNPTVRRGYIFLLDQLMADRRYTEAREIFQKMHSLENHEEDIFYEGDLFLAQGNVKKAEGLWNQGESRGDHASLFLRGDRHQRMGELREAITCYQHAFELSKKPRMVDELLAIAMLYERLDETKNAIIYYEKCNEVLEEDYKITAGILVDANVEAMKRLDENRIN